MFPNNKPPYAGPLPDLRKTFRKETQALGHPDNQFTQFARGDGIMHGDPSHQLLEVFQKCVFEDYFEVH